MGFSDHIATVLTDTLEKLKAEIESTGQCCNLKSLNFSNGSPNYADTSLQMLYILRYYGAYLCEYRHMYRKILEFLDSGLVQIMALGSGTFVDLAAVGFEASSKQRLQDIRYVGYDITKWHWTFQSKHVHSKAVYSCISDIPPGLQECNVIMFPKSISDFDEASFNGFLLRLGESTFRENQIVVASSTRECDFDCNRFTRVVNTLSSCGYKRRDEVDQNFPDNRGWAAIQPGFSIPDNVKDFLENLVSVCPTRLRNEGPCRSDCEKLSYNDPMLRSGYAAYQLVRMTR